MQTLLVCWVALSFGLGVVWSLFGARMTQIERRARSASPAAAPPRAGVLRLVEDDATGDLELGGAGTPTRLPRTAA